MVRLVDHEVVVLGQEPTPHLGVGEEQGVIDNDQVGRLRLGAGAVDVAILPGAVDPDAVERVAGDGVPPDLLAPIEAELGTVAALGGMEPGQELELEHELFGILAGLDEVPAPAAQGDVIGPALQQAGLEVPGQPLPEPGKVLAHQLLLERVGVGRDDHALAVPDGARERRHQVGEALPRPGPGLDHERSAPGLDLGHGEQHLHLRLPVLVAGQLAGERPLRAEQTRQRGRVLGRHLGREATADGLDSHSGRRLLVRVGRCQGLGEEPCRRPWVRRDQREHRLLEAFVQPHGLVAQAEEELARGVGVVERPVRTRLAEPHLGREQGEAVADGSRQEDPGDVQGVEDLLGGVPQAGRLEELDVQPGAVTYRLAAPQELAQLPEGLLGRGGATQLFLLDAGQAEDGVGDGPSRVDQLLESRAHLVRREGDGADLDDSVPGRIETGGLQVQGYIFRQVSTDSSKRLNWRF